MKFNLAPIIVKLKIPDNYKNLSAHEKSKIDYALYEKYKEEHPELNITGYTVKGYVKKEIITLKWKIMKEINDEKSKKDFKFTEPDINLEGLFEKGNKAIEINGSISQSTINILNTHNKLFELLFEKIEKIEKEIIKLKNEK